VALASCTAVTFATPIFVRPALLVAALGAPLSSSACGPSVQERSVTLAGLARAEVDANCVVTLALDDDDDDCPILHIQPVTYFNGREGTWLSHGVLHGRTVSSCEHPRVAPPPDIESRGRDGLDEILIAWSGADIVLRAPWLFEPPALFAPALPTATEQAGVDVSLRVHPRELGASFVGHPVARFDDGTEHSFNSTDARVVGDTLEVTLPDVPGAVGVLQIAARPTASFNSCEGIEFCRRSFASALGGFGPPASAAGTLDWAFAIESDPGS
jgi:hypothetical protein